MDSIIPLCRDFEDKLIKLVWRFRPTLTGTASPNAASSASASTTASDTDLTEHAKGGFQEALVSLTGDLPSKRKWWSWKASLNSASVERGDVEKGTPGKKPRPTRLFAPIYGGLGAALSLCALNCIFLVL
jgi:hypothetical protein